MNKEENEFYKPVILVTGCSSGIGLDLARLLYEIPRYRVVVTARKESLSQLKQAGLLESSRFLVRELDVTSRQNRNELVKEICERWGGVDVLVNNAGFAYRSVMEQMDNQSEHKQMETNYMGPMSLIRQVLPHMREVGRGKIINVSSVSGMLAMPTMGSYSASKHALQGASEALWYELRPFGIDVTVVQPGFINSRSFKRVRYSKKSEPELNKVGTYADYYSHMTPFIERLMSLSQVTSEDVARKILKVIQKQKPRFVVPATPDAVLFYYLRKFVPRRWFQVLLFNMLPGARKWAYRHQTARQIPLRYRLKFPKFSKSKKVPG